MGSKESKKAVKTALLPAMHISSYVLPSHAGFLRALAMNQQVQPSTGDRSTGDKKMGQLKDICALVPPASPAPRKMLTAPLSPAAKERTPSPKRSFTQCSPAPIAAPERAASTALMLADRDGAARKAVTDERAVNAAARKAEVLHSCIMAKETLQVNTAV